MAKLIKYLNKLLFLIKRKRLEDRLRKFNIANYIINSDLSIDVDGDVMLQNMKLIKIPFKFRKVTGYFNCSFNKLTSLEGSPTEVGGYFDCCHNELTSLEFCPSEIGGYFDCSYNKLKMLDCSSYIKGNIFCFNNKFTKELEFFGHCEGEIHNSYLTNQKEIQWNIIRHI